MVGWHHLLNGHEFEQTLGNCEGQGSQAAVHGVCRHALAAKEEQQQQHRKHCPSVGDPRTF